MSKDIIKTQRGDLAPYHFKSYKNGQLVPTFDYKKGEIAVTFRYDGTNDIYIIPKFIVDTFIKGKEFRLKDLTDNLKYA